MKLRRASSVVIVVAALAATLLAAVPSALSVVPAVTVTPSTGLVDGQAVMVTGTVDPGYQELLQCRAGTTECLPWYPVDVSLAGEFSASIWVLAVPEETDGTPIVDCRVAPGACEIVVGDPGDPTALRAPLAFDPTAALRPAPTIGVVPITDLSLNQPVSVTGWGFDPWSMVEVTQCRSDAVSFDGGCDMTHSWSVQPDTEGAVAFGWQVGTMIQTADDGQFDCRSAPGACVLAAGLRIPPDQTSRPVVAALSFYPDAAVGFPAGLGEPPPPVPELPPGPGGVRYLDEVFTDIERVDDLLYWPDAPLLPALASSGDSDRDLTLDILMPKGDAAAQRPVLVVFGAPAWEDFVRRGYVVVDVEFRGGSGEVGDRYSPADLAWLQQSVQDVSAALRWLRAHAVEYRLHPDAFAVTGGSWKGLVSFSLAWGRENAATQYEWPDFLPGGPLTLPVPTPPDPSGPHLEQSSAVAAAAPEYIWFPPEFVDFGEAPVMIEAGVYDDGFPVEAIREICPAARVVAVPCELQEYPVGHGVPDVYRPLVNDRTAVFFYDHMLVPLGVVAGPAPTSPSSPSSSVAPAAPATPATPVAARPAVTG
jgi:hypothetical protein